MELETSLGARGEGWVCITPLPVKCSCVSVTIQGSVYTLSLRVYPPLVTYCLICSVLCQQVCNTSDSLSPWGGRVREEEVCLRNGRIFKTRLNLTTEKDGVKSVWWNVYPCGRAETLSDTDPQKCFPKGHLKNRKVEIHILKHRTLPTYSFEFQTRSLLSRGWFFVCLFFLRLATS